MSNFFLLLSICLLCAISMFVGTLRDGVPQAERKTRQISIPEIGSIQLLNGCGAEGAATKVADYLRNNDFDVKFVGNADTWNYPYTMVISRSTDDKIANQVAQVLRTDKVVKIRNNDNSFDVTVVIGPDYGEKIK